MDTNAITTIELLLERLGGCGLFQVLAALFLHGATMASPWSMSFMAFGNYNPGWTCADADVNVSEVLKQPNGHQENINLDDEEENSCQVYQRCRHVAFNNDSSTIIAEWELLCDQSWVTSLMISVQMGGVLVGLLLVGQMNIVMGRKLSLYGSLALHALLNVITSFSYNWQMFTVMRFCLGVTCGCIMLSAFVYPLEFITNRWRGLVSALPFSVTASISFSVTAMLLRDWRSLHIATAVFTGLWIIPVFWAPESLRWLAVKDKRRRAEQVVAKISKTNGKAVGVSMKIIQDIGEREKEAEKTQSQYTVRDLYRHGLFKRTLILSFVWITNTVVYYAFFYDIQSLSGNFYTNLIIFSSINLISVPFVPLFTNTIGRKRGMVVLMSLSSLICFLLVGWHFIHVDVDKGLVRMILVLSVIVLIDAEWAILQLVCVELYPTVLRPLSFGHGSCLGRVGGMLAPFLIPRDPQNAYISQLIMTFLVICTSASVCLLPESKDQPLEDMVRPGQYRKKKLLQSPPLDSQIDV